MGDEGSRFRKRSSLPYEGGRREDVDRLSCQTGLQQLAPSEPRAPQAASIVFEPWVQGSIRCLRPTPTTHPFAFRFCSRKHQHYGGFLSCWACVGCQWLSYRLGIEALVAF